MKLHLSKKALDRLPEELRHRTENLTVQKMQLLILIRHPDTRRMMRVHYHDCIRAINRKLPGGVQYISRRVH